MMRWISKMAFLLAVMVLAACSSPELEVLSTSCELKAEPVGMPLSGFRLGWKLGSKQRGVVQTAYQVLLADDAGKLTEDAALWDSGQVASDASILVKYDGTALEPGERYFWKVKVWDNHGNESAWSKVASFVTKLDTPDWEKAEWIAYDELEQERRIVPGVHLPGSDKKWRDVKSGDHVLPLLRKDFSTDKKVEQALVFVSGLGHYELFLNGSKVGNSFLAPGWTHYDDFALYNTYDITDALQKGSNAFGVMLGNGFYNIPNERYRKLMTAYGKPMLRMVVKLTYSDGEVEELVTDESWKVAPGPLTFSSIYAGETYNAMLEQDGWNRPGFDDSGWQKAMVVKSNVAALRPELDYPLEITREIAFDSIMTIDEKDGIYLYDFGQNASGVPSIKVQGQKGDTIYFYPAELKTDDMRANQRATGRWHYYTYICKGDGVETWTPQFTYYGFRYVEVRGAHPESMPGNRELPVVLDMVHKHTHVNAPRQGSFETSFELFNDVYSLIDWAIRSNYASVMTDCPHREKLGWLEQLYLMGGGIHYNYDIYHTYRKQVEDMMAAQTPEGLVPDIAPEYVEFWEWFRDSPEWGSASIQVPWLLYKWYGDTEIIEQSWDMMGRYAEYLRDTSVNHILDHGLGDWYDLGPERPGIAQLTPRTITGTAIYYSDIKLMSEMAGIIGKSDEQTRYANWAADIKKSFNETFLDPETGIYSTGSQTAIAMPLVVGLVDDEDKPAVFKILVESIEKDNKALTAGDVGFHYLVKALQENGGGQLLFEMNARDDVPGYGYQLKKGATALTESWAALKEVSNNHLMLGHIMEWFYGGLGGIDQTQQSLAYKQLKIAPQMVGDIKQARATFDSPYGKVVSEWERSDGTVKLHIEVPVNSSALVEIPYAEGQHLLEKGKAVNEAEGVDGLAVIENKWVLTIGSGSYTFEVQ
ncbi:family 78 glycoside hydrolase catalytic domain [Roseimarinus sediminis]|uniref:family 78 glycoside hydrolase catalytic domain n=1 Tax=Roseimarinus sediminis TaxID=1610899 RepID=UPI003D20F328